MVLGGSRASFYRGIFAGILANVITFFTLVFVMKMTSLYGVTPTLQFTLKYSLITLSLGVACVVIFGFLFGRLRFVKKGEPWRWWSILTAVFGAILALLSGLLLFIPRWVEEVIGEVPNDPNFIVVLTAGNDASTTEQQLSLLNEIIVPTILLTILGACLGCVRSDLHVKREARKPFVFKYVRAVAVLALIGVFSGSTVYAAEKVPLGAALRQFFVTSSYLEDNYVAPTSQTVKLPEKKRNLVHIYMESIENSFYSRDLGGYMDDNLMPELAELSDTGVSFSNTDQHGGPVQLYAMGHSVAGMIAMQAGVPMLAAGAGSSGHQMSYPDFTTIGDLLSAEGYATHFMLNGTASWGQLRGYYERHGNFDVYDHERYIEEGKIPADYNVWWGVEDDKLYEYAKEYLTRLGNGDKPFYMVMENADTHFPDGYLSPNASQPFDSQYANVIHYSQQQVVELVKWIQEQPWGDDTMIIVTGDHRSMDKNFFEGWDPSYERTVVNMILNPVRGADAPDSVTKNRGFASIDMFPTIMYALGADIEGDRLGLGTNLFSGKETLVERDGAEFLNTEFAKRSPFYDRHRETISSKPDSAYDNKL